MIEKRIDVTMMSERRMDRIRSGYHSPPAAELLLQRQDELVVGRIYVHDRAGYVLTDRKDLGGRFTAEFCRRNDADDVFVERDKCAVGADLLDCAGHLLADREHIGDRQPRVRAQCLQGQCDTASFEGDDLRFDRLTGVEHLPWVLDELPVDLGGMA